MREPLGAAFFWTYYQDGGWRLAPFARAAFWDRQRRVADVIHQLGGGLRVLDVGCGRGETARFLTGQEVYGLDLAANALSEAQRFCRLVVQGDAQSLPFPPSSFDVALFSEAIYYVSDPMAVLAEVFRILRPGGKLVLACGVANAPVLWTTLLANLLRGHVPAIKTAAGQQWMTRRHFAHQLRHMIRRAGFRVRSEVPYLLRLPFLSSEHWLPVQVRLGEWFPELASYRIFVAEKE